MRKFRALKVVCCHITTFFFFFSKDQGKSYQFNGDISAFASIPSLTIQSVKMRVITWIWLWKNCSTQVWYHIRQYYQFIRTFCCVNICVNDCPARTTPDVTHFSFKVFHYYSKLLQFWTLQHTVDHKLHYVLEVMSTVIFSDIFLTKLSLDNSEHSHFDNFSYFFPL